MNWIKMCSSF